MNVYLDRFSVALKVWPLFYRVHISSVVKTEENDLVFTLLPHMPNISN